MILNLDGSAANVALDAIGRLMDGGAIELLDEEGDVLALLPMSDPAATTAVNGVLEFNRIGENVARRSGNATFARVVAADGGEVFHCDVGTMGGDAVIKLSTTAINRGGPVRIDEFRLLMATDNETGA